MSIKLLPNDLKPREKVKNGGLETLSDIELISIIFGRGTRKYDLFTIANNLIEAIGGIDNIYNTKYNDLIKIEGISEINACQVLAIKQLLIKLNKIKLDKYIYVNNPDVLFSIYSKRFENVFQEQFIVLSLNTKYAIIDEYIAFIGSLASSVIHPREIFKHILLQSAYCFICLHNHPSGDVTPSNEDIVSTNNLLEIANMMSIPFLDHIIIGKGKYFSFKENNLI